MVHIVSGYRLFSRNTKDPARLRQPHAILEKERAMWSTEAATAPQCGAAAAHARAPAFFDASSILCFLPQCITCTQRCCFSPRGLFTAV